MDRTPPEVLAPRDSTGTIKARDVVGVKGGWRDCCIVNAPERRVLGTLDLLRALVSWRVVDDAERWGVGSRCDI
jgi:hypothetical protein